MFPDSTHRRWVDEAFSRFWRFDQGTVITDGTRRELRKHFGEKLNLPDIFIDGQTVAGWFGAYLGQHCIPLPTNASRVMRFDRKAFLDMIRVADEIDFSVSPVCFRHARGRASLSNAQPLWSSQPWACPMSELRDGFFYHPDGVAPLAQMQRLLVGEHNPAYDNLFSTTISEVDDEIGEVEALRKKLLLQLVSLRKKLSYLRAHRAEITQAVQTFTETGEIAPVLIPACEAMVAKEQADLRAADAPTKDTEIANAKAVLTTALPDGWSVTETTADDEFVYVTVRCKRTVTAPAAPRARKKPVRASLTECGRRLKPTASTSWTARNRSAYRRFPRTRGHRHDQDRVGHGKRGAG